MFTWPIQVLTKNNNKIEYNKRCLATEDRKKDVILLDLFRWRLFEKKNKNYTIDHARQRWFYSMIYIWNFVSYLVYHVPLFSVFCFLFFISVLFVSNDIIQGLFQKSDLMKRVYHYYYYYYYYYVLLL